MGIAKVTKQHTLENKRHAEHLSSSSVTELSVRMKGFYMYKVHHTQIMASALDTLRPQVRQTRPMIRCTATTVHCSDMTIHHTGTDTADKTQYGALSATPLPV